MAYREATRVVYRTQEAQVAPTLIASRLTL
jgi:hypothetical protein